MTMTIHKAALPMPPVQSCSECGATLVDYSTGELGDAMRFWIEGLCIVVADSRMKPVAGYTLDEALQHGAVWCSGETTGDQWVN